MYLARLKSYGPELLCVVTLTEELALKQAESAEREINRGKYRGPLHGIPWGVKDLFATKGIKTTWGAEPYRDQVIDYDSTVVERLNEAGAVLVAKFSMGALAQGARWFAGVTRNPWQPEEAQYRVERIVRRPGYGARRTGRVFNRHGNAWLDRFAVVALRRARVCVRPTGE